MADPSLPKDLTADLSVAEAANLAHVQPGTILKWVQRGHLEVHRRDRRGRPRFLYLAVAKAEAKTRAHARRSWPAA